MIAPQTIRTTPRAVDTAKLSPEELRAAFLVENIFHHDKVKFTFTDLDRMAIGGVAPGAKAVELGPDRETGTDFFLERRELGIINTGSAGTVVADGQKFELANLDCLYIGMGTKSVTFQSSDEKSPAKFYLLSCPAHKNYPTTKVAKADAKFLSLGSQATCNTRKLYQYIHQNGIKSCQLVMGFTELMEGNVWNSIPPHTHSRRTEIYFYFDLGKNILVHLMGEPNRTRHLIVQNDQAVLSPPWSIHCGCGTGNYRFIWAMAGENQVFDDMDKLEVTELR